MIRIAILLSGRHGRGSNMQAIVDACAEKRIDGEVVCVISNFASPALARAQGIGLTAYAIPSQQDEDAYAEALLGGLRAANPDLICLAGYIRKVPSRVVSAFAGRIMNIHNALLPSFGGRGMYGLHVHQAVLDYGAKVSGCTVHFVDENYDSGPIILQTPVPVLEEDTAETLAARVLAAEHETFSQAISFFAADRLRLEGRRVRILDSAQDLRRR